MTQTKQIKVLILILKRRVQGSFKNFSWFWGGFFWGGYWWRQCVVGIKAPKLLAVRIIPNLYWGVKNLYRGVKVCATDYLEYYFSPLKNFAHQTLY